jgi:transmembrane sensor
MNKLNARKFIKNYLDDRLSAEQNARLETWYLLKAEENSADEPQVNYEDLETKIWTKVLNGVSNSEQALPAFY